MALGMARNVLKRTPSYDGSKLTEISWLITEGLQLFFQQVDMEKPLVVAL